jgi:hypothetical protein
VKIQVEVFCVVLPCSIAVGYCFHLHPEDRGSKVLQNTDILLQHYTVSQPRRLQLVKYIFRNLKHRMTVNECYAFLAVCHCFLK